MSAMESMKIITLLALLVLALFAGAISASSNDQTNLKEQQDNEEPQLASRSKFVVMPSSLTRFLFYNARPSERQAASGILGYKRSSSALDALTGVTLGKRSANGNPTEYVNWEPMFGRQFGPRSMPRMYDMRWAPFEPYYEAAGPEQQQQQQQQ